MAIEPENTQPFPDPSPEDSEIKQRAVHKLRRAYSVVMAVLLLGGILATMVWFRHTLAVRRALSQLERAETPQQMEQLLKTLPCRLTSDQLAPVYIQRALDAFGRKDYQECRKILQKILDSDAHPEFRGQAQLESANSYFFEGRIREGAVRLQAMLTDPATPDEFKAEAAATLQKFTVPERKLP